MEFTKIIRSRESIRNYDPARPVPRETLEKILDAGRIAPSACNDQPWKFLLVSTQPLLDKIRNCYPRSWFADAPHILVAIGLKEKAWVRSFDGYNSVETDVTIAFTHIILAAENEGVSTCWIAAFNPFMLREALNLGQDQTVYALTPLGYPKKGFKKGARTDRKSLDEIAEFL